MQPGAAPLWEQLVILILGPPIMTILWWLAARGWALAVQAGSVSERTRKRQKMEIGGVLILFYLIGFSMALYAWLK